MDPIEAFMAQTSGAQIVGRDVQQSEGRLQRIMAGLPRQSVAAGATADLSVVTSELFRPDKITLSVAAQALDVSNVRCGTKAMNCTPNVISGNCFSQDATDALLQGYTAAAGVGFIITVVNNTAGAITTGGGVFGWGIN